MPVPQSEHPRPIGDGGERRVDHEAEPKRSDPRARDEPEEPAERASHPYFLSSARSSFALVNSLLLSRARSSIWMAFLSSPWRWLISPR